MTTMPSTMLTTLRVEGFRSIKNATVDLAPINVLIGPNGAGKSNVLTALRLLPVMQRRGLASFVGEQGGASRLMHYGTQTTSEFELAVDVVHGKERWSYHARFGHRAGDELIIVREEIATIDGMRPEKLHRTNTVESAIAGLRGSRFTAFERLVERIAYFHFDSTSLHSPMRSNAGQADNKQLHPDGSNLAAMLYRIKHSDVPEVRACWSMLEGTVRRFAPFIRSLEPDLFNPDQPERSTLRLYWIDERGHRFDAHDLSDGTLRAIALCTALLQPPTTRPVFIALDEPELGLHPAALSIVAALARSVSTHTQIMLVTQSPALLDEFAPEEVIVAERCGGESSFRRLDPKSLEAWLDDYSLSQLYDKNVLGGQP